MDDISNMPDLTVFKLMRRWQEILWPVGTPFVADVLNKYLVKTWPFSLCGLMNVIIAKMHLGTEEGEQEPVVSVVVPARNEAGNIEEIFARVLEMGGGTKLIFVEGNSKDDTCGVIEEAILRHPKRNARLFRQIGEGKGDAVRLGFANATGEILMILDADMTVPREDLSRFYDAIREQNIPPRNRAWKETLAKWRRVHLGLGDARRQDAVGEKRIAHR